MSNNNNLIVIEDEIIELKIDNKIDTNYKNILLDLFKDSITSIITTLSYFLIYTITLIILGHTDETLDNLNIAQIGISFTYIVGILFLKGSMNAFDSLGSISYSSGDNDIFHEIYNDAKLFNILFFLIIFLPICFSSNYILLLIGYSLDDASKASEFIKLLLIPNFFDILLILNSKVLQILGKYLLTMYLHIITLIFHTLCSVIFIYALNMGVMGAGISLSISSICLFTLSTYFIYEECEPFKGKSILTVETYNLDSYSKIYYYIKSAIGSGILIMMNDVVFQIVLLLSVYLGSLSITTNTIIKNYIGLYTNIMVGFSVPIVQKVNYYIKKKNFQLFNKFIKAISVFSLIISLSISILNYAFKDKICLVYLDNQIVCENFSHIINLYCIFILFDTANNIVNSILKGINSHVNINIVFSLFLIFLFLPLGILLSFTFKYDYAGFWYSIFLSWFVFLIIQSAFLLKKDLKTESKKLIKDHTRFNYNSKMLLK